MKKQTLLEKACMVKDTSRNRLLVNDEELELMMALVNSEITMTQAVRALGKSHGNIAQRCFATLRHGISQKRIARIKRISENGE